MTKAQKQAAIERAKPLFDFLDSYDARLLGEFTAYKPYVVRLYVANLHIMAVTLAESGWAIFLPASEKNYVADTFKNAEAFLGPRPGAGGRVVA